MDTEFGQPHQRWWSKASNLVGAPTCPYQPGPQPLPGQVCELAAGRDHSYVLDNCCVSWKL